MTPTGKFFSAIGFLAAAGSIVAIGIAEIHRRHGHGLETSATSREIIAELSPGVAPQDRASLKWQSELTTGQTRNEAEEAARLRSEMEREDRSAWSKFID